MYTYTLKYEKETELESLGSIKHSDRIHVGEHISIELYMYLVGEVIHDLNLNTIVLILRQKQKLNKD